MGDLNNLIVINYYKLLTSMTADYKFDMNEALYDINSEHFTITFSSSSNITSNNAITIKIASGYTGSADSMDLNSFTSNISVELVDTKELKSKSWYTAYCLYNEASNKWSGYLISAASDTSSLENKINNLESNISNIQNQIYNKQDKSNLVTDITNRSTNSQYPSAKLLYDTKVALETSITDAVNTKQEISNIRTTLDYASDNTYPSTSLLSNIKINYDNILQFDTVPTVNSEKLLKSGAIATALNNKADTTTLNTQVNNLTTEINKKANQTDLNTAVSDLTTEIGKKANSESVYTKSEIDGLITGVFYYKGSVDTFAELPATAKVGDTYNVKNADAANNVKAGDNVVWCEIDGVGYWDVLSGIVDLSAYETAEEIQDKLDEKADLSVVNEKADKTDLDNYLTSEEVQTELDKKANKIDMSTEITNIQTALNLYAKKDETNTALANKVDIDENARLITNEEASKLANIEENANKYSLPAATTTTLGGIKVGENLSISEDGTISATSLAWDNVQNKPELYTKDEVYTKTEINTSLNAKVDKVTDSRLMTENEGAKLASITATVATTNRYTDLDNIPCLLTGVDETFIWDGSIEGKFVTSSYVKIDDIEKNKTLSDYRNSFKYFLISNGIQVTSDSYSFRYRTNTDNTCAFYAYNYNGIEEEFFIAIEPNASYSSITFPESGIYCYYNSDNTYISEIKFEGQFTPLKPGYLPAATTSSLGGVKVGANLSVSADGTISATSLDWDNVQNKPELYTKDESYNKTEVDTSLNTKQDKSNLVTSVNQYSTDEQYPSAKLLYTINSALQSSINTNKTDLESSIDTTKSDLENSIYTTELELQARINNKQDVNNLVTSINSSSTDTKYPSAKLLYTTKTGLETQIDTKQDKSNLVISISASSTDEQYPSAKLLYDIIGDCDVVLDEISALIGE